MFVTGSEVAEAKLCYEAYHTGRRSICRENHEPLGGLNGWYILVVRERDDLTYEQRQEIVDTLSTRVTISEIERKLTLKRK